MTSLLSSHLEQISLCATSIAELPFPGPKIFTNALLANHDITRLIRDTEQHERALFHLASPPLPPKTSATDFGAAASTTTLQPTTARRATTYGTRNPKNKAVAAVLGGDLYQKTRAVGSAGRQKGDLDVEVSLHGAEKLAAVYPIPGATDKIAQLRRRHQQLQANIAHYEARVNEQTRELQALNRPTSRSGYSGSEEGAEEDVDGDGEATVKIVMTKEDLAREEDDIKELERKKKGLEERVEGMERDLGGLMR